MASVAGAGLVLAEEAGVGGIAFAQADPLPSWNDTAQKQAILSFVQAVTTEGSPDFVPPSERVAVFDNDGTLSVESPNTRKQSMTSPGNFTKPLDPCI